MTATPPRRWRRAVLLLTLLLGLLLFVWRLGTTGLVDETPPLFAAAARAMTETGDWLIPRVNGLPRYDKPPLVYWLMGLVYALPGQERWNPLGTWAAAFPSVLATLGVMLALADTLLRWPQPPFPAHGADRTSAGDSPGGSAGRSPALAALTALAAALAFALSPLVLLWGRVPVSDGLFSGLVAGALLLCWRCYIGAAAWWPAWLLLGLAVLTKGPVAVMLLGLTLLLFAWLQADAAVLWRRLRPGSGLALTALVALPWYVLALWRDGRAFWDSFFGYHNLQRFTSVVNDHLQPWWYFGPVMLIAALPVTPLLVLGLGRAIGPLRLRRWPARPQPAQASLGRFAACWLLAVLLFFTLAATKLPSYWLPATPAAALLVALGGQTAWSADRAGRWAWLLTLALAGLLALVFLLGPLWVPWINDPEMPTLPAELLASGRLWLAAGLWLLATALGWGLRQRRPPLRLLALQLPMVLFVTTVLLPCWALGDRVRSRPVRSMAASLVRLAGPGEPVAMVGILKPSLHYYSRRVVIYEGIEPVGLINLAERLRRERRPGQPPSDPGAQPTVLVVIDGRTASAPFWQGLEPQELSRDGLYHLWRLDRGRLERRATALQAAGHDSSWQRPRPERY